MGLTPSEGLVMGTRSGDIDPNLAEFVAGKSGLSSHEINSMLNRESGLLGISGLSNDMRTLIAAAQAPVAFEVATIKPAPPLPPGRTDTTMSTNAC